MSNDLSPITDDEVRSIDRDIESDGFAIRRPQGLLELCNAARAEYIDAFENSPLQSSKKRFSYRDLSRGPWRKQAIGSKNGVGESYAQILQTIYFDCQNSSFNSLNLIFRHMNKLRNRMMKVDPDFGSDPVGDKFWNACRVHHYPRGGGFMVTHRDTYFPIKLKDLPFYQIMVPLSAKGRDFDEGGGILVNKQGGTINTDEVGGMGSIIVFDGRIQHGVEDVDPGELLNFQNQSGRLAAFSNLYVTPD